MEFLTKAQKIEQDIIKDRRHIHMYPELNMNLPNTIAYVKQRLKEMGYVPKEVGGGIIADVGKGDKAFLLRADMDALPMEEDNSLDYKSTVAKVAHTCGHDMHTAMLLGAAKLLKDCEDQLKGTVRLMFQPDEEGGKGCKSMVDAGVLENPTICGAMAMHTAAQCKSGDIFYTLGSSMASSDIFTIEIKGVGGHGGGPHHSIDPINIGCHINLGLQELIARESPPSELTVLTICSFNSGSAANIIPNSAQLKGTLRTHNQSTRDKLVKRIEEICEYTAKSFRGTAEVEIVSSIPVLFSEKNFTENLVNLLKQNLSDIKFNYIELKAGGSEDFAHICNRVPSSYMSIGTGFEKDGFLFGQHHPKVIFDESCMVNGAAVMAEAAYSFLNN